MGNVFDTSLCHFWVISFAPITFGKDSHLRCEATVLQRNSKQRMTNAPEMSKFRLVRLTETEEDPENSASFRELPHGLPPPSTGLRGTVDHTDRQLSVPHAHQGPQIREARPAL